MFCRISEFVIVASPFVIPNKQELVIILLVKLILRGLTLSATISDEDLERADNVVGRQILDNAHGTHKHKNEEKEEITKLTRITCTTYNKTITVPPKAAVKSPVAAASAVTIDSTVKDDSRKHMKEITLAAVKEKAKAKLRRKPKKKPSSGKSPLMKC